MSDSDILLIGVDGGATEAKAHAVSCEDPQRAVGFGLRPESAARVYSRVPGFEPVPLAEQLAQRDAGNIQFAETERQQGNRYIAATAEAVVEVARACGAVRILVGVGMPGLKTAEGGTLSHGKIDGIVVELEQETIKLVDALHSEENTDAGS